MERNAPYPPLAEVAPAFAVPEVVQKDEGRKRNALVRFPHLLE